MNFQRRKKRRGPEISMTSMVDVVLLLLFFFMASTHFHQQTAVKIHLPTANSGAPDSDAPGLILAIDAHGTYHLHDDAAPPQRLGSRDPALLQQALARRAGAAGQAPLLIHADGKTPHQAVIGALEAAAAAGFSRVRFAAQQRPDPP